MTAKKTTPKKRSKQASTTVAEQSEHPPLLVEMAAQWGVDVAMLQKTIMNTCIKGPSGFVVYDYHVVAFLVIAREYKLQPLMGEIHAFIKDGAIQPIIGVDGRTTLVNRQAEYDGVEFTMHYEDGREHPQGKEDMPYACTCRIFHKNRSHPTEITEDFSEVYRNTAPWRQHPRRMLRHKAFSQCARIAFGLRMYDEDDFTEVTDADVVDAKAQLPEPRPEPDLPLPAGDDGLPLDMTAGPDEIPHRNRRDDDGGTPVTVEPTPQTKTEDKEPPDPNAPPPPVHPTARANIAVDAKKQTDKKRREEITTWALEITGGDKSVAQSFIMEWSAGLSKSFADGYGTATAIPKTMLTAAYKNAKEAIDGFRKSATTEDSNGQKGLGV